MGKIAPKHCAEEQAWQGGQLSDRGRAVSAPLHRGRQAGDRQQPCRAQHQAFRYRQKELALRQYSVWSKGKCDDFQHHRNSQGKRPRPIRVSQMCFHKGANLKESESVDILLPWNTPDCCRSKLAPSTE